jgi:hypothetical protein
VNTCIQANEPPLGTLSADDSSEIAVPPAFSLLELMSDREWPSVVVNVVDDIFHLLFDFV